MSAVELSQLPSCHDFLFSGYQVDCDQRLIAISVTTPTWVSPPCIRTLNFSSVIGYHFKDDAFGNIIGAFREVPIEEFVEEYGRELSESFRISGALDEWATDTKSAVAELKRRGARAVVFDSVTGISGWILTEQIDVVEVLR